MPADVRGTVALVAESRTVHHERFLEAIRAGGWRAELVPVDPVAPEALERLARTLRTLAADVVLAGPLPGAGALAVEAVGMLGRGVEGKSPPVIVASWGSDLLHDVEVDPVARTRAASALRAADAVLVDCRAVAAAAVELGADPGALVQFPWGVDLAAHPFCPREVDEQQPLRVLSLRSLAASYLVGTLLEALVALPAITCTVAGDGPEAPALEERAVRLGVAGRITWAGRVTEPEVAGLLATHDLHVSTAPTDGSSISLLQAMAVGCPSVVVDNPANREWIEEDVTGWLVPAADGARLADVLARLDRDRSALPGVARAARAVVEERADWSRNRVLLWELLARLQGSGRDGSSPERGRTWN
jgi:L-malate glycosyltransferase